MWSVINSGPVAQLRPMYSRSACSRLTSERLGVLARQHGAHGLDGAGDGDGHSLPRSLKAALDADQRRFHIACVLARFR